MFIEQRILDRVAYGTQCGVEFKTKIATLRNGAETRKRQWLRPLDRFTVIYNLLLPEDRRYVAAQFRACGGMFAGFRFRDPLDYTADREFLGIADGTLQAFQLRTAFQFGPITEYREVYKPVATGHQFFADDLQIGAGVNTETGIVNLQAPAGAEIFWSGEFDKPVRFDADVLMWSYDDRAGAREHQLTSTDLPLAEYRILT